MRSVPKPASLSVLLGALTGLALLTGADAQAQGLRGPMTPEARPQSPRAEPPALPGLAGRQNRQPIPAEPGTEKLSPTEALFDAINRGDLTAARDAAARGADLHARNVLGLTPLDSAVDQGRNEIAFFLLSARGSGPVGGGGGAAARGAPLTQPPAPPSASAARREPPMPRAERVVPRQAPVASSQRVAPQYGSSDGGAPLPAQGFLGFEAGRPGGG